MPRVMIDVNKEWLNRLQAVIPAAIDSLNGWAHQIDHASIEGGFDADDVLQQLRGQMEAMRRSLESVRIIF